MLKNPKLNSTSFNIKTELNEAGEIVDLNISTSDDAITIDRLDEIIAFLGLKQKEIAKNAALPGIEVGKIYYMQLRGRADFLKISKIEDGEVYGFLAEKNRLNQSYHIRNQEIHIMEPQRLRLAAHQPETTVGDEPARSRAKLRM